MRTTRRLTVLMVVAALAGCRDDRPGTPSSAETDAGTSDGDSTAGETEVDPDDAGSTGEPTDDPGAEPTLLSPTDHLIRASLALRGTRPSLADLDAVRDDPDALEEIVDTYLASEAFGTTIRDIYADALLLRASPRPDLFYFPLRDLDVPEGFTDGDVSRRAWEAPLRLVEHVVMNDRPFTEIVTADYLLADGIVAQIWGLEHDGAPDDWVVTQWPDDRPRAGLLSDSMVFFRHKTMPSNANRGRANLVSTALLCNDFLSADIPIEGGIDLSDPDAVADAVVNDPSCASCHSNLDPMASYLFGHNFFQLSNGLGYPTVQYFREQEPAWQMFTEQPPALFGEPGEDLGDMGEQIAAHPLFSECAVRRFYGYLTQTGVEGIPPDLLDELDDAFVASDFDARDLARRVVLSDAFAVSHAEADAEADTVVGYQRVRPRQLERMVTDLTGFTWMWSQAPNLISDAESSGGELPLLSDSFFGFEALAGGMDGYYVTQPSHTVNPTTSLVVRRLAALAAGYVVEADFASPNDERRLLTEVESDTRAEDVVRTQLVSLHARLFGEFVADDSGAVDETHALFAGVLERTDDPRHAWQVTLTAMLQDFRLVHY